MNRNEELNINNYPSTVNQNTPENHFRRCPRCQPRQCQKHTKPKTHEGKFKSCLNALKHSLNSYTLVIKTEDADIFENF